MGWLGKLLAPEREKKIVTVREITREETYKAFSEDGGFTEQECRDEANLMARRIDKALRKR